TSMPGNLTKRGDGGTTLGSDAKGSSVSRAARVSSLSPVEPSGLDNRSAVNVATESQPIKASLIGPPFVYQQTRALIIAYTLSACPGPPPAGLVIAMVVDEVVTVMVFWLVTTIVLDPVFALVPSNPEMMSSAFPTAFRTGMSISCST